MVRVFSLVPKVLKEIDVEGGRYVSRSSDPKIWSKTTISWYTRTRSVIQGPEPKGIDILIRQPEPGFRGIPRLHLGSKVRRREEEINDNHHYYLLLLLIRLHHIH